MEDLLQLINDTVRLAPKECQRIFHGRGQCYPGFESITVDWYPPLVWVNVFKEPEQDWLIDFKFQLQSLFEFKQYAGVSLQIQYRYLRNSPIDILYGEAIHQGEAFESDLRYQVKFGGQQNTGLFLDMANGRQWVSENAKGASVLNLFAYTCAFSVSAIAGGATKVVNIDMAKGALSWGRENHRLNQLPLDNVKFFAHDVLNSWGKLKKLGPYDLLIVDPPSFQRGSFIAKKDYAKMARRFGGLLTENGKVLACLNAPELDSGFLMDIMEEEGFQLVERIENPDTFPEINPEKGLKVMVFQPSA